jgi:hypothetical protein
VCCGCFLFRFCSCVRPVPCGWGGCGGLLWLSLVCSVVSCFGVFGCFSPCVCGGGLCFGCGRGCAGFCCWLCGVFGGFVFCVVVVGAFGLAVGGCGSVCRFCFFPCRWFCFCGFSFFGVSCGSCAVFVCVGLLFGLGFGFVGFGGVCGWFGCAALGVCSVWCPVVGFFLAWCGLVLAVSLAVAVLAAVLRIAWGTTLAPASLVSPPRSARAQALAAPCAFRSVVAHFELAHALSLFENLSAFLAQVFTLYSPNGARRVSHFFCSLLPKGKRYESHCKK